MKNFKILVLLALSFILTACDDHKDAVNGELPAELVSAAQNYMGTYNGQINRRTAALNLRLEGNKVLLSGTDPVADACQSSYGLLKSISYTSRDNITVLTGATFDFNPNLCSASIEGRTVSIKFENNKIDLQLIESSRWEHRCNVIVTPGNPPYTGPGSHEQCTQELITDYITGSLIK